MASNFISYEKAVHTSDDLAVNKNTIVMQKISFKNLTNARSKVKLYFF